MITKKDLYIIKFTADWCGPCKTMDIVWNKEIIQNQILHDYKNKSKHPLTYDVDIDKDKVTLFKIKSIPAIFIIDDEGFIYKKSVGIVDLNNFLKNPFQNQDHSPIDQIRREVSSQKPEILND